MRKWFICGIMQISTKYLPIIILVNIFRYHLYSYNYNISLFDVDIHIK